MQRKLYKIPHPFIIIFALLFITSCQKNLVYVETPVLMPANLEVKYDIKQPLGIIGEIEPSYILPMKSPFLSRIDTGAQTSSIDVQSQKTFERDGKKWVSFTIVNRDTGEKHEFERKIEEIKKIKRAEESEERIFVVMEMKIGNQTFKERFSLAQRDKFNYQILIGRNVLTGRAIVDTALKNTLQ